MSEERKRILKMLESGAISVEEAEKMLEQVEESNFLSEHVEWEEFEKEEPQKQSTKKKVFDFLNNTVKKIKNADLDFNFGPSIDVSHVFFYQATTFNQLQLEIENGSVDVRAWDEEDVRIECKAKVYKVNDAEQAKKLLLEQLEVHLDNKDLKIKLESKKMKADLILYVPRRAYEEGKVRLFNGPISLKGFYVNTLNCKTSNGDIELQKMKGDEWEVKAVNSDIRLVDVNVKNSEVEALTGSIQVEGEFGKLDAQLVNGSIHCKWFGELGHTGFFKTTTGSIDLNLPPHRAIDGELKTTIGSIHCDLPEHYIIRSDSEVLKKQLHFQTKKEANATLFIEAETKTGSIKVKPIS
ncbi:DUF4097 and DUF4098 domain-containing protein YvlB [Salirhabdus euzebyi]|uniref:DUF4097 and DUF4098 domain-containing protein YvlB n=1 Tax=Salirhabdus euzebyi TaxID=394506 RepID=A0A841Q5G0_9BACI|nr:DUF4097 domain-containing protein [Salirhabdus euzebyi]MBB6453597.1 DUF4097 and DUF4098 domain-containing protein YvlB [Salirhabdus euzebyi]